MNSLNRKHTRNFALLITIVPALLILAPPRTPAAPGTGSPFELEIGELDKGGTKTPAGKEKKKPRPAKPRHKTRRPADGTVQVERQGEYLKYAIQPGDHLYKVLTTRFGLSSAKAEELIPEILRLNGIANISRLRIGQVILIPAARVEPGAVATAEAAPKAAAPPPPRNPESPGKPGVQASEGALPEKVRSLWAKLFPERGPKGNEPGERIVGDRRYPVFKGADFSNLILVREGSAPPPPSSSGAGTEPGDRIVSLPADDKPFVGPLLKEAGFEKVEEKVPFSFGADPRVTVVPDFALTRKIPATEARERILLFADGNGCNSGAGAAAAFLSAQGYRAVFLCDGAKGQPAPAGTAVSVIREANGEEFVDALLEALAPGWKKSHPVEIVLDQKEGYKIGVKLDRYFENQGERYFLDFGRRDAIHDTLMQLVELAGYRRITVDPASGGKVIAARLLSALKRPADFRKRTFTAAPGGSLTIEATCLTFDGNQSPTRVFVFADPPLDKVLGNLLAAGSWVVK